MNTGIRVLLADDHPIVRQGLRFSFEASRSATVVAEASDGEMALESIKDLLPDVAVLDIDMPKLSGLDVARQVRDLGLKTKVILLTLHSEGVYLRAAFDNGAHGYLMKDSGSDDVLTAIRTVLDGQKYVSPTMAQHLIGEQPGEEGGLLRTLSPAERRVMKLIADGKSSKEIGDDLGIHYRTVDNHRTNICRKLKLEGVNSLARFALQHRTEL